MATTGKVSIVKEEFLLKKEEIEEYQQEKTILLETNHPNLITYYSIVEDKRNMDYIEHLIWNL